MSNYKSYYTKKYNQSFYYFDNLQFEIPPNETIADLNNYDANRQQDEILKCTRSFSYFCHKFVKILHPTRGLIPFIMFKYQKKCIENYENKRFNIISKFRQGGLTTTTLLWGMWRCMFQLDQQVMLLSKTDREATIIGMMVDRAAENLPNWLKSRKEGKWNDHLKQFQETGGNLMFYSPEAARGKATTLLIIDEAAFIPDMDTHWKAMWPVLSTGGSCVIISTVNGVGNWYEETYSAAKDNQNLFNVIDLDYWEHPDYNDVNNPNWAKEQKSQLGERGFLQEVLRVFLGSGETYISSAKLTQIDKETKLRDPLKKLMPQFANRNDEFDGEEQKGALWIWKEPQNGQEYIIGVDSAEGIGDHGDSSCIQVINQNTLEQVAEFYSNNIATHDFAQVCKEIGSFYNSGLLVIENMSTGGAILNSLQHDFYYDNLYYDNLTKTNMQPGIKITIKNRTLILQNLQQKIYNDQIRINSRRLAKEIKTFEYNTVSKKAQAQKGKHDDAIMSIAIALYAREQFLRDMPSFGSTSIKESNVSNVIKNQTIEELRNELRLSLSSDNFGYNSNNQNQDNSKKSILDEEAKVFMIEKYRKNDTIMKEFGW